MNTNPTIPFPSYTMDGGEDDDSLSAEAAAAELRKGFETLEISQKDPSVPVYYIYLNSPATRNALSLRFFSELPRALRLLSRLPSARALVLAARGPHFCSGIHLPALRSVVSDPGPDPAAHRFRLRRRIVALQAAVSAIERCPKPVVAEIGGACVGGGVDLVLACDVRCCDASSYFAVREVDMALAADIGTLQRLPRVVGHGRAADLALTGRSVAAAEAKEMGLVTRVFPSRPELEAGVFALAKDLAEKSALAVMGTKAVLLRSRDLTVDQGLDYVATWNSGMLLSQDLEEAVSAYLQKRKPIFSKL